MRAQKASAPVRLARLAALAVLVVVAGYVIIRLAGRREGPRPAAVEPPAEGEIVDLKEQVRHQEYKDGKLVADIRGASFFRGPDGRNHLRGSVEVVNLGPAGAVLSRLTADEVVYDPGTLRFNVTGRVRVEAAGVVLEGGAFDYDKAGGLFATAAGGVFSSKTMTGRAAGISYAEGADEVRLSGGFRVELASPGRARIGVAVSGGSFVYRRGERRGFVEGQAILVAGLSRGEARSLAFTVMEDESGLGSAALTGAAHFVHEGDAAVAPASVEVLAEEVRLSFGPDGGPAQWTASGGFRAELDGRTLEGESASFDVVSRILRASGGSDRPATAESAEARVEAASIFAGPAGGDLEASGSVKCLLKPGRGPAASGFFSAGEAATVASEKLSFRGGAGPSFAGNVEARQGRELLRAGELAFFDATGGMAGGGGVTAELVLPAAEGTSERRVRIGGERLDFSSSGRALSFAGKAYVELPEARLEAGTISAVLVPDGKTVGSLAASTGVVFGKGRFVGRSGAAAYEAGTGRVTLTGRPVIVDEQGGAARGDKLTFNLADDTILVENEGQGRSTTVIKS
jgi:lipopolysaccharide export system protein LptA